MRNAKMIFIFFVLFVCCSERITRYEEVYIETPIGFPDIHIYDENNNEIFDTLYVNFERDAIKDNGDEVLYFQFTNVIKFDSTENFKKIDFIQFDEWSRSIVGRFRGSGTHYEYINYSIKSPQDSIVIIENKYISRSSNDTTQINNRAIYRFEKIYYSIDSTNVFGKTRSFIMYKLD